MNSTEPSSKRAILRDAIGIALPTGAYGASFGALSTAAGLSIPETVALSALMFTGASQFAFISVATTGGTAGTAVATAILLGTRNSFYGLRLARLLRAVGLHRFVAAHFVIDETTAMAVAQRDERSGRYAFWSTGIVLFLAWNSATIAGAFAGTALSDPKVFGLDVAPAAAYLALVAPQLRGRFDYLTGIAAAAVALCFVPIVPVGVPVLIAAFIAVLAGLIRRSPDPGAPQ